MEEEDFRDRLGEELDAAAGPPLGALVAAATADGERQRRRRWAAQITAGTVGVAAVVAGATFAAGHVGQAPGGKAAAGAAAGGAAEPAAGAVGAAGAAGVDGAAQAAKPPASPTPTPSAPGPPTTGGSTAGPITTTSGSLPAQPTDTVPPNLPPVPPGQARTTGEAMALLLERNVAKNGSPADFTHITAYAPSGSPQETQKTTFMADLFWDKATIAVRYTLPPAHRDPAKTVAPGGDVFRWNTPGQTGTSEVKLEKGERGVELTRADGSKVMILELNGLEDGNAGADRPDLPFTSDQLLAMARDVHWGPTMDKDFVAEAAATIQLEPRVHLGQ